MLMQKQPLKTSINYFSNMLSLKIGTTEDNYMNYKSYKYR